MQCPDCSYIGFKQAKVCGSCGFNFKKAATSAESLFRKDSFSIFAGSSTPEGQEASTTSEDGEKIAVMDPSDGSPENQEMESGDFILNLSDALKESSDTEPDSQPSDSDTMDYAPMEFGNDSDMDLHEVEGLGLGLEPIETPLPETSETEIAESLPETIDEPELLDLNLEDGLEPQIEISLNEESLAETPPDSDLEEAPPVLDINGEVSLGEDLNLDDHEELELNPETSQSPEQGEDLETELEAPILDLGEEEITLELGDEPEIESPIESPAPPTEQAEDDELVLNLEIDDSDGPLTTSVTDAPEIEIEDLGLELEDSDPTPSPDPEKP